MEDSIAAWEDPVMAREEAGYFIHDWQEFRNQVSQMIIGDSRYKAITSRPEWRERNRRGR